MKFDGYLAAYLYETKSLTLQGIGTFALDSNINVSHDHEKGIYYPIDGLSFKFNPKADIDNDLIAFLQKKLGKIQPLVRSDLESYLANIKQFINLGKPYTIEGIGTLAINNKGEYEFTAGSFLPVKEELNPKRENEEHNYPVKQSSSPGRVFVIILIIIAGLAALGGIGWGVSKLFAPQKNTSQTEETSGGYADTSKEEIPVVVDTPKIKPAQDTSAASGTSLNPIVGPKQEPVWYKWVFEVTPSKERALSRINQLARKRSYVKSEPLYQGDSIIAYRLFLPFKASPSDTARVRDSLQIFFGGRVRIVKY